MKGLPRNLYLSKIIKFFIRLLSVLNVIMYSIIVLQYSIVLQYYFPRRKLILLKNDLTLWNRLQFTFILLKSAP